MSYRSILVHVEPDADAAPRLSLAADLANSFEAGLIGVAAEIYEPNDALAAMSNLDGEVLVAEAKAVEAYLADSERKFRETARLVRSTSEWRGVSELPHVELARQARAADLLVVGPRRRQYFGLHDRADPGDVFMAAGRPVLACPLDCGRLDADRVLIAWKDTREARRAAADAMPFLQRAKAVVLAEVCAEDEAQDAHDRLQDVADWLGRHGVAASVVRRAVVGDDDPADVLLDLAQLHGAGLVVAGGFGHARLREWVFGGVTDSLLGRADRPVLFSH